MTTPIQYTVPVLEGRVFEPFTNKFVEDFLNDLSDMPAGYSKVCVENYFFIDPLNTEFVIFCKGTRFVIKNPDGFSTLNAAQFIKDFGASETLKSLILSYEMESYPEEGVKGLDVFDHLQRTVDRANLFIYRQFPKFDVAQAEFMPIAAERFAASANLNEKKQFYTIRCEQINSAHTQVDVNNAVSNALPELTALMESDFYGDHDHLPEIAGVEYHQYA